MTMNQTSMSQTGKSAQAQFYENYVKQLEEADRKQNILSPIHERISEANETNTSAYNTIDSNSGTVRRMNPADDRPINSSGAYNTVDANEKTVRSMTGAEVQAFRKTNPTQQTGYLEERPIRASGAYNYQNQGIEDRPINASGAYRLEENKNAVQLNFDDEDEYSSDYEDDFESDDEDSTALESTGATPNLNKPPSVNQQQELDRVVQTYAEILE